MKQGLCNVPLLCHGHSFGWYVLCRTGLQEGAQGGYGAKQPYDETGKSAGRTIKQKREKMTKVKARQLKKELQQILATSDRKVAVAFAEPYSLEQLTGPIFSQFYHPADLVKFRSIALLGAVAARTAPVSMEGSEY